MAINYQDMTLRRKVWEKGIAVSEYDSEIIRKDAAGAWMIYDRFGKDDPFGWEIDHIFPRKLLEEMHVDESLWDDFSNLRPMNYINNRSKGSNYPEYIAKMKSEGTNNVECSESFIVNQEIQNNLKDIFGLV